MSSESFYSFTAKNSKGQQQDLKDFKNKLVLIVNVASQCGFTPQYAGLEKLFAKYQEKGLVVLGFPCNQFGFQEPGNDEEIQSFCSSKYNVSFPVMAKVDVNGDKATPLYQWLKSTSPGILGTEMIKWNFTKFLVDKNGSVFKRYAPNVLPEEIEADILTLLA